MCRLRQPRFNNCISNIAIAMGVYLFQHLHSDYVKVGVTKQANPWDRLWIYRFPHFGTVRVPLTLHNQPHDIDSWQLLHWFPALTEREEREGHKRFENYCCGEYYPRSMLPYIVCYMRLKYPIAQDTGSQYPRRYQCTVEHGWPCVSTTTLACLHSATATETATTVMWGPRVVARAVTPVLTRRVYFYNVKLFYYYVYYCDVIDRSVTYSYAYA
jgi:hypothetical protein